MPTPAEIREETPRDAAAVRAVNVAAFETTAEAEIVEALRSAGAVTLSLVALVGPNVVGHILFSPITIATAAGERAGVGLAPIAVHPHHQRHGVGSLLVRTGLERLRGDGHGLVVVLGHPTYYPRFGFRRASTLGLRWELDAPDDAFMALALQPDGWTHGKGVVAFRPELTAE